MLLGHIGVMDKTPLSDASFPKGRLGSPKNEIILVGGLDSGDANKQTNTTTLSAKQTHEFFSPKKKHPKRKEKLFQPTFFSWLIHVSLGGVFFLEKKNNWR